MILWDGESLSKIDKCIYSCVLFFSSANNSLPLSILPLFESEDEDFTLDFGQDIYQLPWL